MHIQRLDHFTIRTENWEQTAQFFAHVVGLQPGPRPAFRFPGHWMYAGGQPVLHIVSVTPDNAELEAYLGAKAIQPGSGAIDHVSLRAEGLAAMQQHLLACQVPFRERVIPAIGEHQLFLEEPNGITVELIFPYSADNRIVGQAMVELEVAQS